MVPKISKTRGPFEARLLAFAEAGDTAARYSYPADPVRVWLASAGVGVRANLAHHFSLIADYGWQLRELPYPVDAKSRGHIRVTLAY
jgi:hemolysin activation/secretion protein